MLSLLENLSINFPFHFILSLIGVYRDLTIREKLIFPSTIMRLLGHCDVPFPSSEPFHVIGAMDVSIVKCSEVQLRLRWFGSTATLTPSAPSTSAPSSSASGVTLDVIMAQLQCMDACLDTLSTEL